MALAKARTTETQTSQAVAERKKLSERAVKNSIEGGFTIEERYERRKKGNGDKVYTSNN